MILTGCWGQTYKIQLTMRSRTGKRDGGQKTEVTPVKCAPDKQKD
jgi:hypothetical protein